MFQTRYNIDYSRFKELTDRILFNSDRPCTDAVCCFQKVDNRKQVKDKGLVIATIDTNINVNNMPLHELVQHPDTNIRHDLFYACEDLGVTHRILEGNRLEFKLGCTDYPNRHQACRSYPRRDKCDMDKYMHSPRIQQDLAEKPAAFFYAFEKAIYEELQPWAIGTAKNLIWNYLLIPIPNKRKTRILPYSACSGCKIKTKP